MSKTLILTPNKTEMCGMYQLAKDLAKEFDGEIRTREDMKKLKLYHWTILYDQVITLMYPMHKVGFEAKRRTNSDIKWICYNQGIPPVTKTYFPNFWRRQAMRYINWRNNITMQGADKSWDITEREQKPRWTKRSKKTPPNFLNGDYALYLGRRTDYKNYHKLCEIMAELNIHLKSSENWTDDEVHQWLSNAKMLVTASTWEGYGRPVMEAEALGVPVVAYDVGTHKKHIKKGICVPLDINNMSKSEKLFKEAILEVWRKNKKYNE